MKLSSDLQQSDSSPILTGCPVLRHWFKGDEVSGSNAITDSEGGVVVPASNVSRTPDGFGIQVSTAYNAAISGASWYDVGSKDFMVVSALKTGAFDIFSIGNTGAERISIATVLGVHVHDGTNDYMASGAANDNSVNDHVLLFDEDVKIDFYENSESVKGTDDLTSPDVLPLSFSDVCTCNLSGLYGIGVFVFDNGLPPNVLSVGAWMAAQWRKGKKVLHPATLEWS